MMVRKARKLNLLNRNCRYMIAVFALLIASCAAPARAALPTPDPAGPGTPFACRERAGQVLHVAVDSAIYRSAIAINVYVPPCYTPVSDRLPVIYLLHGGNADETQWPDLRVAQAADDLIAHGAAPFVVVMPGGDYRAGIDYAAFVLDDLLPEVERQFQVSTARAGRAIGGISLGGYWALKLAFSHPDLFVAAGGHSPVIDRGHADDPLDLARTANGIDHLAVTLDAGAADTLRTNTRQLAAVLQARGTPVALSIKAGKHDRVYWRAHTPEYLQFYRQALK
jgi:enterochelin esterase-like enzyme